MKKLLILTYGLIIGLTNTNAQSSIQLTNNSAGGVITDNSIIYENVPTGGQSHVYIQLKNIGSVTNTYSLKRTDVVLNSGADAYFCFGGQCFPSTTTVCPVANYVTLTAGQNDTPQSLYYDENLAAGYSEIKYELYNVNNLSDAVTFTFKFNSSLASVKDYESILSSISDIYPNPSINKAQLLVSSRANINSAAVNIINTLGTVVSTKNIELAVGKNTITLDLENLSSGIYFATISVGDSKVIKKFTINK